MDAEAAFWEERGEGAAATLGKFDNEWGTALLLEQTIDCGGGISGSKTIINIHHSDPASTAI